MTSRLSRLLLIIVPLLGILFSAPVASAHYHHYWRHHHYRYWRDHDYNRGFYYDRGWRAYPRRYRYERYSRVYPYSYYWYRGDRDD